MNERPASVLIALALAATAEFLAPPAVAQQDVPVTDRPVSAVVGSSVTWDSNVFLLPDSVDPQAQLGKPAKSDRISRTFVGLIVDKPYAQQRFQLDARVTAIRYDNFSFLDFNALQYRGAWAWHFTPRVSGLLSADRSQSLANYGDFRVATQRNVLTNENRRFSVDAWLFGGWHAVGGITHQEAKYSALFTQVGSYRADGGEAGVKYVAPSGNSIAFNLRSLDGRYIDRALDFVNLIDDGFRRSERELAATWAASGKSSLDGRLAWVDYHSSHFAERDFSGMARSLAYRWQPTAKLAINVTASRDFGPWQDTFASYRVDDRLSLGPTWQIGARTALRISIDHVATDFRNPIATFTGPLRHDTTHSALLAVEWKVLRNLSVNTSIQRNRRTSTDPGADYGDSLATLGASLTF